MPAVFLGGIPAPNRLSCLPTPTPAVPSTHPLTTSPSLPPPQVMRGKDGRHNTAWSLRSAQEILQESFDPIMDLGSNTDLLPVMLYARRAGEWDYSNCLTLLLRHKVGGRGGVLCVGGRGAVMRGRAPRLL